MGVFTEQTNEKLTSAALKGIRMEELSAGIMKKTIFRLHSVTRASVRFGPHSTPWDTRDSGRENDQPISPTHPTSLRDQVVSRLYSRYFTGALVVDAA